MQRFVRAFALAAVVGLLAASGVLAAPGPQLNYGQQINASQCQPGKLVINVTWKALNDADSGFAGNAWAYDNYTKSVQIWQTGSDTFCASVQYEGKFTTVAGASPNSTLANITPIPAGITGTMHGGYIAQFTGTLNGAPEYATHGNLGTFDYQCDASFNCPGAPDWTTIYFSSMPTFDQPWWGWIYRTGQNGTWVNASTGSSGDITG